MNERLRDKLNMLPSQPGVYKMLDAGGKVIYVGKAVSLKNRVRQYFQASKNHSPKVLAMVSHIEDLETIVVSNETEALTLESNLIKELMPKYNILLKDDKHFPYVRINLKADFPRVEVVRRQSDDGALYLGPYLSTYMLANDMSVIREHFPIRHCKKDIRAAMARRERPCLMHQLGRCCAPCSGKVSKEEYHQYINDIIKYLNGNTAEVLTHLKQSMEQASQRLDFEQAAAIRDRIRAIEALSQKQVAITTSGLDADAFAVVKNSFASMVYAVFVRNGKIVGTEKYSMQSDDIDSEGDILQAFITQYYLNGQRPPKSILLSCEPSNMAQLCDWLSAIGGRRVQLSVPKRGEKAKLTAMALNNGLAELDKAQLLQKQQWERTGGALLRLGELLGLNEPPGRMECFDNSHTQGTLTVSSMVVFTNGKPDKMQYRRFRINSDTGGDDLLAMQEVLMRRLSHGEPYADLMIIDGGPTQLNAALQVLSSMGLEHINVIALAERHEQIFLKNRQEPIELSPRDAGLHMLERIRDEAHRFAIAYHRSLQQKKLLFSKLDDISGIGEIRKRALFDAFITIDAMQNATVEQLAAVKGMTLASAQAVYKHLHLPSEPGQ